MNYLDLFSGVGGFHLGLLQAGFKFDWTGHSEIDKYAKQIYQKHFPGSEDLGDVKEIRIQSDTGANGYVRTIPSRINLITFGFPCQDLSIAGKRRGLKGKRSGLFNEAMRIVRATKPGYFIFENVKGLFSSNEGRDFEYILREIADSGYDGGWQLLNTRWFLPQNRERIYFVGHLRGERRPEVFPIGEASPELDEASGKAQGNGTWGRTISNRYHKDGSEALIKTFRRQRTEEGREKRKENMVRGEDTTPFGMKEVIKEDTGVMPTLTAGDGPEQKIDINSRIRRLTPTECERLQGFPDGWTEGLSDTQRYKTLGNAVSVPVVKAIGKKLFKSANKNI